LVLSVCTVSVARPEAVAIDHKAVGCIVVGKYPKMNACFTPAAELARSRVYFRPEGAASWYYVEMKSEQPCFTGTLPKPGKKLVGKKIEYYLEAQNKAFEPARTAEFDPIVVKSAQECKKNVPVAPFLNNATVAVFPSVPAGFVGGGIGTAAVVGIVGAGAAVAGTTAIVVSNNNNDTTTTTIASSVNTTTTLATVTTTTTTTTLPKVNHAPNAVLKVTPDPPQGLGPLTVIFDLCSSSDPDGDPLSFFFTFGDGATASGSCIQTHTYAAAFREASRGGVRALDSSYLFEGSVVDPGGLSQTRTRTVIATKPAPVCDTPSVAVTAPKNLDCVQSFGTPVAVTVNVTANDARGISNVNVKAVYDKNFVAGSCSTPAATPTTDQQTASGSAPNFTATLNLNGPPPSFPNPPKCFQIGATATNSCGSSATSSPITFIIAAGGCTPVPYAKEVRRGLVWSSDLDVDGGRLQMIVNGSTASYPQSGRSYGIAAFVDGQNRVEATLVEGKGKAGLWRLEFLNSQAIAAGSIHVVAGDVVTITESALTFRLNGTAGERIAFTFDKK